MKKATKHAMALLSIGLAVAGFAAPASAASVNVKADDTLWKIAKANQVSLAALIQKNSNLDAYNLQPGQIVELPDGAKAGQYVAKDNDTFWTIARQYKLSLDALIAANPNVNARNIYAGLKLNLPGSGSQMTALSVAPAAKPAGKTIQAVATAYSDSVAENAWGAVDYIGNPLKLGTVAVDPSVIPLGSKVLITGYSYDGLPQGGLTAYATDTGSAIKGNRIDIFLPGSPAKVSEFGIQNVTVQILN